MLPCAVPWKPKGRWEGRGGEGRVAAGEEPRCYRSPAFDGAPGLTLGQPGPLPGELWDAVHSWGQFTLLAEGEESFDCGEGGGERALGMKSGWVL